MDLFRRASELEEYAAERMREMEKEEEKRRKKKGHFHLNCCHESMLSSTGSEVPSQMNVETSKPMSMAKHISLQLQHLVLGSPTK